MKFSKLGAMILCFAFLLVACGKENNQKISASTEPKVDLSDYPTGVQNGDVSADYFDTLMGTITKHLKLPEDLKDNSSTDEKKELYRKYLLYLNGLNYKVSNDTEQEIDNYFSSFLFNAKHWAEYRIKHLDTNSDLDHSVANNYFTDAKNDLLMTMEVMEKYNLDD